MWAMTALSLLGVWLNIKKDKRCFILWTMTNFSWMIYDWSIGAKEQAALFAVYFILSLIGLHQWNRDQTRESQYDRFNIS